MNSKRLIAIDPGTTQSGVCVFEGARIADAYVEDNSLLVRQLSLAHRCIDTQPTVVIEMIASYGMAVGKETFETCVWIGRFMQVCEFGITAHRMFRKDVKIHICGTTKAKDANIWQAILDRYGGKAAAIGKKNEPGPLYGVKSHARAALAVGLCWLDGVRSDV